MFLPVKLISTFIVLILISVDAHSAVAKKRRTWTRKARHQIVALAASSSRNADAVFVQKICDAPLIVREK